MGSVLLAEDEDNDDGSVENRGGNAMEKENTEETEEQVVNEDGNYKAQVIILNILLINMET